MTQPTKLREAFEQQVQAAERLFSKGDIDDALPHFRRASLVRPESEKIRLRIAQCLDRVGQREDAYQAYRRVLLRGINRCEENLRQEVLQAFTNLCHRMGRDLDVIECLKSHSNLMARTPALFYNLGLAYYKTHQFPEARDVFTRIKATHPANAAGYIGLAILHCHHGKFETAVEELREGMKAVPGDPQLVENLSMVQMKMGNNLAALTTLMNANRVSRGRNARILHLMGMAHLRIGDLTRAETYLRQSIEIDRTPDALRELAWLKIARGEYVQSVDVLKEALAINPEDIWTKLDLAIAYFKQGITTDARDLFEQARKAAPNSDVARILDDMARIIGAERKS